MDKITFEKMVDETIAQMRDLLVVKGGEYAGSEDRLANFKRGAALTGATPMQVLFIYLSKHYDSIATYIRDDATGTERRRSESIRGRVHDAINYLILLEGLIVEKENAVAAAKVEKQDRDRSGERPELVGAGGINYIATVLTGPRPPDGEHNLPYLP